MTTIINPRADLPIVAAEMYRALKSAGCRCKWAWGKNGYGPVTQCSICAAVARYEAITEATT